jgi:hypothetical protein
MKYNTPPKVVARRGITLVELTVVIFVLLALTTVVFVGSRAWKRGSDRAACVLNLRNVQVATRSYQNMYVYREGSQPDLRYGTRDIARHLVEGSYINHELFDRMKRVRPCPGGGFYECGTPDVFPPQGQLYLQCSLSKSERHGFEPESVKNW